MTAEYFVVGITINIINFNYKLLFALCKSNFFQRLLPIKSLWEGEKAPKLSFTPFPRPHLTFTYNYFAHLRASYPCGRCPAEVLDHIKYSAPVKKPIHFHRFFHRLYYSGSSLQVFSHVVTM